MKRCAANLPREKSKLTTNNYRHICCFIFVSFSITWQRGLEGGLPSCDVVGKRLTGQKKLLFSKACSTALCDIVWYLSAAITTSPHVTKTQTHSHGTAPRHRRTRPPSGRSCRMCRWFLRNRKERTHGPAAQRTSEVMVCWVVRSCCLRRCDLLPPCLSPGGRQRRGRMLRLLFLPVRQMGKERKRN